jgi:hypothetical protein
MLPAPILTPNFSTAPLIFKNRRFAEVSKEIRKAGKEEFPGPFPAFQPS